MTVRLNLPTMHVHSCTRIISHFIQLRWFCCMASLPTNQIACYLDYKSNHKQSVRGITKTFWLLVWISNQNQIARYLNYIPKRKQPVQNECNLVTVFKLIDSQYPPNMAVLQDRLSLLQDFVIFTFIERLILNSNSSTHVWSWWCLLLISRLEIGASKNVHSTPAHSTILVYFVT